jgi:hypothetical protein
MNIVINAELKAYIDPLTAEEHEALERSILADGCRDALVLWGDTLVDGHNRYGICQQHGLPFQTVQNPRFESIEDVYLWMIDQHLGRRSVSNFQRGVLARDRRRALRPGLVRKSGRAGRGRWAWRCCCGAVKRGRRPATRTSAQPRGDRQSRALEQQSDGDDREDPQASGA